MLADNNKKAFSTTKEHKKILESDTMYFGLNRTKLINRIIDYYASKKVENFKYEDSLSNKKIQFRLDKINSKLFYEYMIANGFDTDSNYLRSIVKKYVENPRDVRQEIIFSEIVKPIREAIKEKKRIQIIYDDFPKTVDPYTIKTTKEENNLYLFCYCNTVNDYRSLKISSIKKVIITSFDSEYRDEQYINKIIENFDPFRTFGEKVEVKFTENGVYRLSKIIHNRPNYKYNKETNTYLFDCNERLAQIYFAQFYDDVEILKPLELREWFKDKLYNTYKKYIK